MDPLAIIILAAGLGKRMGLAETPKVVVRSTEKALIEHVLETAQQLSPQKVIVVTGHRAELVEEVVRSSSSFNPQTVSFARQQTPRGTGDAVKSALPTLGSFIGNVLILCGDVPLLKVETLQRMLTVHTQDKATLTALILRTGNPTSYGRFMRSADGAIARIIEARDCTPEQLSIGELNSGVYVVDSAFLAPAVNELTAENVQKEYYLTDIVERAAKEGQKISSIITNDEGEIQGVNTRVELAAVNQTLRRRRIESLILAGVEFDDPQSCIVEKGVQIAAGARIGPQVQLRGNTSIATDVVIEGCAYITDASIASGSRIKFGTRIEGAQIASEVNVGPFAHLRPGTILDEGVKVGNFVETKKAHLHKEAKASHLTYLGDCEVGADANIGAGTITCNYDGENKFNTTIGERVFIGSNSSLVAPVSIGAGAVVGAGSVITKDIPAEALGVTRAPQMIKEGWAPEWRKKRSAKNKR